MKKLLLLLIAFVSVLELSAQGYDISVKVNGLSCHEELLLANHYGDKQYLRDTAQCKKGIFHFTGEKALESGIYLVVLPNRKYFEIVVSAYEDQTKYYFQTDTSLQARAVTVKGSRENQLFFELNVYAAEQSAKARVIREALESAPDDETKKKLVESLNQIRQEVSANRSEVASQNQELFIGKVYKAMEDIVIPEPSIEMTDSAKRVWKYIYMRSHFWDNIDLGEDGMVRTPFYHSKLEDYFKNYVPPVPDTSIVMADALINEMDKKGSKEQFKYTIHFLLKYFQEAKYMCFDKALYHITKNYYCNGRAFWADSSFQQEMCEQSAKMAPTLCDLPAPDMNMPDSTFTIRNRLHAIQSPVTVVVFWDIDCGHCKKEMPIIKQFYDSCNKDEVTIYAVYTQGNWEGWKKFIREKELHFMNVANAFGEDDFRKDYNITSTPQIYVLDREKKIRFKKIAAKDIASIVDHLLKEQKEN